ncbi:MAG: galactokinase [Pseudomonadota bacterium]
MTSTEKTHKHFTTIFTAAFDRAPVAIDSAPGRINLIGEHTDYNGGLVLPTALKCRTTVLLAPRSDKTVQIKSDRFEETAIRKLGDTAQRHWSDHALGAVCASHDVGLLPGGADICIFSDIPDGAGLSSSAALIVAILKAARKIAHKQTEKSSLSDVKIALMARDVENNFIGVPCGIMDQMAAALATPEYAMILDTKTLSYEFAPLPERYTMAVIHSGVTRRLNDGRYKDRKLECDAARESFGVSDICTIDPELIRKREGVDPTIRSRALHCATEHRRVQAAVRALRADDMGYLGDLMRESHASMRDDFEMSTPEIDALVDDAQALGAIGARLTGGGFGGCVVAMIETNQKAEWTNALLARHAKAWPVTSQ